MNMISRTTEDEFKLWHHRFGHPVKRTVSMLPKFISGLENVKLTISENICEGCIWAKSCRKPFGEATNHSNEILEWIHIDVCSPMPVILTGGARYLLTFIDDATRYVSVYALEKKSNTFEKFIEYRTLVEKQTGKSIKILHSDGEGEFINTDLSEYLSTNSIHHKTTVAETPEQNGVAERYNWTLLETIRAMMLYTRGIPKPLWAEFAATAVYLRNRLPT